MLDINLFHNTGKPPSNDLNDFNMKNKLGLSGLSPQIVDKWLVGKYFCFFWLFN